VDNPHYLREWKSLPEGVYIAPSKFGNTTVDGVQPFRSGDFFGTSPGDYTTIPVPRLGGVDFSVPCIAFDYQGRVVSSRDDKGQSVLPLMRGSTFFVRNPDGTLDFATPADFQETPPKGSTNHIHIDSLTGRAKVIRPEIQ
jgi:hypothetical protein